MADQTDLGPARPEPADPRPESRPSAGRHARPEPPPVEQHHTSFWKELPVLLLVAFLLAFLVKSFVVQAFYIPSGSMEQTLEVGDRVLVNKLVYKTRDIARGDVVVFNGVDSFTPEVQIAQPTELLPRIADWFGRTFGFAPPDERDFVKRVIGVGGDRVACCDAQGRVTVNGVGLDEAAYLYPGNAPSDVVFDVVVPEGKLWVMGDHRGASSDSRSHLGDPGGGFVPVDRVIGRAFAVLWPGDNAQWLEIPSAFQAIEEEG
jgi:signal peptidase I